MMQIFAFLPSAISIVFAGALVWRNGGESTGWGYFLGVGVVLAYFGCMAVAAGARL